MNNYFEGELNVFLKLIDGYARNEVLRMSLPHKKRTTCKNENCKNRTKLHAAHIIGFERKKIISRIISPFVESEKIKIDIDYFKEKFTESHTPFERVIKILCAECHTEYEKDGKLQNVDFTDQINFKNEKTYQEEITKIEKSIKENLLENINTKKKILDSINKKSKLELSSTNCSFSNLIKPNEVWWLEPYKRKLEKDFYFVLNDDINKKVYVFLINKHFEKTPLKERNDKQYKIEIKYSNGNFTDRFSEISFKKFLIKI